MTDKIVREEGRRIITGISPSTALRLEKEGLFPIRRKLGMRAVGWLESELLEWVNSRQGDMTNE